MELEIDARQTNNDIEKSKDDITKSFINFFDMDGISVKVEEELDDKNTKNARFPNRKKNSLNGSAIDYDSLMGTPSYPCSKCTKEFDSKTGLLNHLRMHLKVKTYLCLYCQEQFQNNNSLLEHLKIHHKNDTKLYICKNCEEAFSNVLDWLIHIIKHTNRSFYKCEVCGTYTYSHNEYIKHVSNHFDNEIKCNLCPKTFNNDLNMKKHLNNYHINLNTDTNKCGECGKSCTGKKDFVRHMNSHAGIKPHQCFYCGEGFLTKQSRTLHTMIHTGEKPFKCEICSTCFTQKTTLTYHMYTHKEKTIECKHCNKKFNSPNNLRRHMMSHSDLKRYPCSECDKSFATTYGLTVHIAYIHCREKPYQCDVCNIGYKLKSALNRHLKCISHKNEVYGKESLSMNKLDDN